MLFILYVFVAFWNGGSKKFWSPSRNTSGSDLSYFFFFFLLCKRFSVLIQTLFLFFLWLRKNTQQCWNSYRILVGPDKEESQSSILMLCSWVVTIWPYSRRGLHNNKCNPINTILFCFCFCIWVLSLDKSLATKWATHGGTSFNYILSSVAV